MAKGSVEVPVELLKQAAEESPTLRRVLEQGEKQAQEFRTDFGGALAGLTKSETYRRQRDQTPHYRAKALVLFGRVTISGPPIPRVLQGAMKASGVRLRGRLPDTEGCAQMDAALAKIKAAEAQQKARG